MVKGKTIVSGFVASALVFMFAAPTVMADHLDRFEIKRIVRKVEERTDVLQDRIDDWVLDRPSERIHRTDELYRRMNHFVAAVDDLKSQLRDRDEPWELRDQARSVVDTAVDLGHVLESDFPDDFHRGWVDVRDSVNDLAHAYHLHEVIMH